jgi:hypothetical protein
MAPTSASGTANLGELSHKMSLPTKVYRVDRIGIDEIGCPVIAVKAVLSGVNVLRYNE